MNTTRTITPQKLLWLKIFKVKCVGLDGEIEPLIIPEVKGRQLLPANKADLIGSSPRSVRRWIRKGYLNAYNENGTVRKPDTKKGKIHFCLLEWRKLKFEELE